jgi:TatD DNase family protein
MVPASRTDAPVFSDSHAHLTDDRFDADRHAAIARAREAGLRHIITVSSRVGDAEACADLAAAHDLIHFPAGVHPHEAKDWSLAVARGIERALGRPKAVAIGEIGLDYHFNYSPPAEQRSAFREQIALARALGLPIVIHTRQAWDDTFAILRDENAAAAGGVFHCFSCGPEEARRCLDLGFYLSFAGPITFKNAGALAEAAAATPLDRLMIETDAPYLSPHPLRGRRNEPARVVLVAERLAALKGVTREAVGLAATRNLEALFRLTGEPPSHTMPP